MGECGEAARRIGLGRVTTSSSGAIPWLVGHQVPTVNRCDHNTGCAWDHWNSMLYFNSKEGCCANGTIDAPICKSDICSTPNEPSAAYQELDEGECGCPFGWDDITSETTCADGAQLLGHGTDYVVGSASQRVEKPWIVGAPVQTVDTCDHPTGCFWDYTSSALKLNNRSDCECPGGSGFAQLCQICCPQSARRDDACADGEYYVEEMQACQRCSMACSTRLQVSLGKSTAVHAAVVMLFVMAYLAEI